MYYVYVLQSELDHGLYIGFSQNLAARIKAHHEGQSKSTCGRRPLSLIYYEAYNVEADAMGRERFLKSGGGRSFLDKQLQHHFLQYPRR